MDLVIRNGRLVTPHGVIAADLGIAEGKIAVTAPSIRETATTEIDAGGAWVLPGMIDAHVHFNEPGRTDWEGWETGSRAAAAGGVTTVFEMPLNANPPTNSAAAYAEKDALAREKSIVNYRLWGGLVPGNPHDLPALRDAGVVGFKAFMSSSGTPEFERVDASSLETGMAAIQPLGLRLALHAEDEATTQRLAADLRAKSQTDAYAWEASRPIEAECIAIETALRLARDTGCPIHIVHVSCAEGIDLITQAKANGIDVTCETCPHYLCLTLDEVARIGATAKCAPPIRSEMRQTALWERVLGGNVDTIGSDHSPCPITMKASADTFFDAWGGISGVQHSLPLLFDATERFPRLLPEIIAKLTATRVADVFGLPRTGRLQVGAEADIAILRTVDAPKELTPDALHYRNPHSPYVGRRFSHAVTHTICGGSVVWDSRGR